MHPRTFQTVAQARAHLNSLFMSYSIKDKVKPYDYTIRNLTITNEQGFAPDAFVLFGAYGDFFIIGETSDTSEQTGVEKGAPIFLDEAALEGHADDLPMEVKAMLIAAVKSTIVPMELLQIIGKWRGILDTTGMDMDSYFMEEMRNVVRSGVSL